MAKIKRIDDAAQFLSDTGLLFRINREILHPLGLAMEIQTWKYKGKQKAKFTNKLWDYRRDPEGMLYADETFTEADQKHKLFMKKFGEKKLKERYKRLGYIIQPHPAQEHSILKGNAAKR